MSEEYLKAVQARKDQYAAWLRVQEQRKQLQFGKVRVDFSVGAIVPPTFIRR